MLFLCVSQETIAACECVCVCVPVFVIEITFEFQMNQIKDILAGFHTVISTRAFPWFKVRERTRFISE